MFDIYNYKCERFLNVDRRMVWVDGERYVELNFFSEISCSIFICFKRFYIEYIYICVCIDIDK